MRDRAYHTACAVFCGTYRKAITRGLDQNNPRVSMARELYLQAESFNVIMPILQAESLDSAMSVELVNPMSIVEKATLILREAYRVKKAPTSSSQVPLAA